MASLLTSQTNTSQNVHMLDKTPREFVQCSSKRAFLMHIGQKLAEGTMYLGYLKAVPVSGLVRVQVKFQGAWGFSVFPGHR